MEETMNRRGHLLSFYECISGIVHDQFLVDKKKNEESACKAVLHPLLVKGRIISADAMFSCRDWCAVIYVYGGYYFIPIKKTIQQFFVISLIFSRIKGLIGKNFSIIKRFLRGMEG